MRDYNDIVTFNVLGKKVGIICTDTVYGRSVVAEIDSNRFYLGITDQDEEPNISLAVLAWQGYFNKQLTDEQFDKILRENAPGED